MIYQLEASQETETIMDLATAGSSYHSEPVKQEEVEIVKPWKIGGMTPQS